MLVTDPTTGYLHEVPGYTGWGGYAAPPELGGWYGASGLGEADPYAAAYGEGPYPVAYDGFGNPVGAFPALAALAPLALKALPFVASALPGLLKSFLGNPQLGYTSGYGYAGANGLGYYGEPDAFDGYYAEPYVDPAMGYSGYGEPGTPQQVAFDGFGNPVGAFPALAALAPLALKALPMVASALPGLLKSFFGNPQLGYAPGYGYAPAGGLGYYGEPEAFDGYGGYYAEPYIDPAMGFAGHSGYSAPGVPQQVVYDGFGNPVGAFPALAALLPLAAKILPSVLPAVPSLLISLFGGGRKKPHPPAAPGLGGWGEADFDGYGYYGTPGGSMGYAPAWGAPAGYGGYGQVVYDGFGNPVGSIPALASLASKFIPAITRAIPKVTGLIQRVLPQARQVVQSLAPMARGLVSALPTPAPVPIMPPPMDESGGDGPEPVVPVAPVVPVTPVVPVGPLPVPYPGVPGMPRDMADYRQLLRRAGGAHRRHRRGRRRRHG